MGDGGVECYDAGANEVSARCSRIFLFFLCEEFFSVSGRIVVTACG